MKKNCCLLLVSIPMLSFSQANIGAINSGAIIATSSSGTLGELIVIPETQNITGQTGILGILVELKDGTALSKDEFELSGNMVVYPNPTTSSLRFETKENIEGEKIVIYNNSGILVRNTIVKNDKTIDLEALPVGIYVVQFENKKVKPFKIIKQ
jgi:hypothetical protein